MSVSRANLPYVLFVGNKFHLSSVLRAVVSSEFCAGHFVFVWPMSNSICFEADLSKSSEHELFYK
jgi:hypothetical protein